MEIKVGLYTYGAPEYKINPDGYIELKNLLIGNSFHWERVIPAKLPGRIIKNPARDNNDKISIINILPLETYLQCVVCSEMNPNAPIEFLKAHSIISRSWSLGKILRLHPTDMTGAVDSPTELIGWDDTSAHTSFDVCSDDHCQRYQGLQPISPIASEALSSTEGIVLTDVEGHLIDTRFSKCCGGITETFPTCWQSYEMAALESFADPWCNLAELPVDLSRQILQTILKDYDFSTRGGYRWQTEISKENIRINLAVKFGRDIGEILSVEPLKRGASGRIHLIEIKGTTGTLRFGKELWIRRLLSDTHLYSSAFDIVDCGDKLRLNGRGWGHGVGLCQIGAARMAYEGKTCAEILNFYYPGSQLTKI